MGNLKGMIDFLNSTNLEIIHVRNKLDKLQSFFNGNFINVDAVRNAEITFLQKKYFEEKKLFPKKIIDIYNEKLIVQEREFERNLKDLKVKQQATKKNYIKINEKRAVYFKNRKKVNVKLDTVEEDLKERIAKLDADIAAFNKNIDELNVGFGFIANLFKMRKIQIRKTKLVNLRTALVEEIETVRQKWIDREGEYVEQEKKLQQDWSDVQADFSIINEKVKTLSANRKSLIKKAAFMDTLDYLKGDESFLVKKVDAEKVEMCPRCKSSNEKNRFFCNFCGERFSDNRPDVLGSLVEVGELNEVYRQLQTGMGESVSVLALMKGIMDGINVFVKSVKDVKRSQDKYPSLSRLKIDVPAVSKEFSKKISDFYKMVDVSRTNLHPHSFALSLKEYIETEFANENIEAFFTQMGDELNRTTGEQW